jgi:NADPH:quinone reductase-like Zn-dependent oxidoreductase
LSPNNVLDYREASFLHNLKRETKGKGVDVVLNTLVLTGEMLHTSWSCVADFGRMVDIGKNDLTGIVFQLNKSYASVDIGRLLVDRAEVVTR